MFGFRKEFSVKLYVITKNYLDFEGVYLYGSFATGMNNSNSDIDIVALFQNSPHYNERRKLWQIVSKIEAENDIIFDLHPMTNDELKKNPIYYNQVVNKGVFYGI